MKRRYVIYGLLGLCLEVFWRGLDSLFHGDLTLSGTTYIWMFFIYGLAVLLEPIHNRIGSWPVILRGGVYTAVIFFIEYSTGTFLKLILGTCPWNYGNNSLSINGLITLRFIPVWFCAGLLFELAHNTLLKMKFSKKAKLN